MEPEVRGHLCCGGIVHFHFSSNAAKASSVLSQAPSAANSAHPSAIASVPGGGASMFILPFSLYIDNYSILIQLESTPTEGERKNEVVARQPWRVVVAVFVHRMPSLSRVKSQLALKHEELLDQVREEKSKLSDFELEELEHNRVKRERIKKAQEDEQLETKVSQVPY